MMVSAADKKYMKYVIEMSKKTKGKPYTAIIVYNDKIIGTSEDDTPIKHTIYNLSQLVAIESAKNNISGLASLEGCVMYSNSEPNMMGYEAILYEKISKLVFAVDLDVTKEYYIDEPNCHLQELIKQKGYNLEIVPYVLEKEALKVFQKYKKTQDSMDDKFIDIAIELSKKAKFPYGAIVVKHGKIIGSSDSETNVSKTAFTHAELIAIEEASERLETKNEFGNLKGCTIYTSCEPCMMCLQAIIYEGISKIVYAATLEDSDKYFFKEYTFSTEKLIERSNCNIEIVKGLHRKEAVKVIKEHNPF